MPVRSRWRNQFQLSDSASKFHNKVGRIFATDKLFKNLKCYQEVPVKDLVDGYDKNHFFDWYVEDLNTIVELHGAQHYKAVNFGDSSYEEVQRTFKNLQARDTKKKVAATSAGYEYVAISYKEYAKLTARRLQGLILGAS